MDKLLAIVKKYISPIFNTRAAGLYMLLFAAAIGVATFIENDFGTSSAQKVVFKSWWFELLLVLFGITIIVNIFKFRMIPQKKWALLTFHSSMIVILIGAGVTRYFGYEGIMHIRENDTSNTFLSAETYLNFEVINAKNTYQFNEQVLFATLGNNKVEESYLIGNDLIEVKVKDFIPNPIQNLEDTPDGKPTVKIVMAGVSGREEYYLSQGETRRIRNLIFNFKEEQISNAINISYKDDFLGIKSVEVLTQMTMTTQEVDTLYPAEGYYPLKLRSMYAQENGSFVVGDFKKNGTLSVKSEGNKVKGESMTALLADVSVNGETREAYIYGKKGLPGRPAILKFENMSLAVSYGAKEVALPFSIKLYDFIMERYPGTNNASSYASEVQLIDARKNIKNDFRIYMNNILNYGGYRFFQSSFDQDEKGTYLSVNNDFWGTWISYLGYFLLTLGMIISLFSKKNRFYKVSQNIKKMRAKSGTFSAILFLLFVGTGVTAQKVIEPVAIQNSIDIDHADKFSQIIVQDHKGRMKPLHTMTREIMRKIARKESLNGLSAEQVVLGMFSNSREWHTVPMIKLGKHEKILNKLNVSGNRATYNDFFNEKGEYILKEEVRRAYGLQPIDRGVYEKELMKIDERVNITSMVYSGRLFKIIPVANDPNNTWVSSQLSDHGQAPMDVPVANKFFGSYVPALREATQTNDYTLVNKMLDELADYQRSTSAEVIPSPAKAKAEILLNKLNVFGRLAVVYILLGLAFLFFLFLSVFRPKTKLKKVYNVLFGLVVLGFAFHTLGLGLRWFVSGRAPWSNGYESMIYIAWTTTLAGVIFSRKSFGGLAATMVLAATVLLVASLSYLDPEITPLVPVLKSYWLTIHVSLEAGSYGFLMLGAIIGLINLLLMIFLTEKNKERVYRMIKEMSYISELTLIGGLFMVSIGTYLGGVWANESWGRYWGWDAKETWALVTILVYAFILHMRIIPKLGGLYAYNLASLFGWASVVMTYYGVNYYLSGLHSYAAGDPVPVPQWVYTVVISLIVISALAYWRKRKYKNIT
jgi:cytochrome c-type biogenesis protein CcsB